MNFQRQVTFTKSWYILCVYIYLLSISLPFWHKHRNFTKFHPLIAPRRKIVLTWNFYTISKIMTSFSMPNFMNTTWQEQSQICLRKSAFSAESRETYSSTGKRLRYCSLFKLALGPYGPSSCCCYAASAVMVALGPCGPSGDHHCCGRLPAPWYYVKI